MAVAAESDAALAEAAAVRLAADFPLEYGGSWVDFSQQGAEIFVAVAGEAARREAQDAFAGLSRPVRVRLVDHSVQELDALAADLAGRFGIGARDPGVTARTVSVAVDGRANRVKIEAVEGSRGEDAVAQALRDPALGDAPIVVELVDDLVTVSTDACSRTNCDPPLRGGLAVQSDTNGDGTSDGNPCTNGYNAKRSVSGTTEWLTLTSGHCSNGLNVNWKHSSTQLIGPDVGSQQWGSVDGMLIRINDTNHWKPTNKIYKSGDPDFQIVSKISNPGSSLWGNVICRSGRNSSSCGELLNHSYSTGSFTNQGAVVAPSCGGDSGGPWFNASTGRAYGLHRGSQEGLACPGPSWELSHFTWVSNFEAAFGGAILITDPGW